MNMTAFRTLAAAFTALALTTPVLAQDTTARAHEIRDMRDDLQSVVESCPANNQQRACIHHLRKMYTAASDYLAPALNDKDKAFRACTTAKALDLETQYYLDLQSLNESQWIERKTQLIHDSEGVWQACGWKPDP